MKLFLHSFLIVLAISFSLSSCTLEKRLYSSGYHINWKKGSTKTVINKKQTEEHIAKEIIETSTAQKTPENNEEKSSTLVPQKVVQSQQNISTKVVELVESKEDEKQSKDEGPSYKPSSDRSTDGMAVIAFILSLVGLFIFGIIAGILAVILGGVSLSRIQKDESKKGTGLAIAAIIIGLVDIIAVLIYVSQM